MIKIVVICIIILVTSSENIFAEDYPWNTWIEEKSIIVQQQLDNEQEKINLKIYLI